MKEMETVLNRHGIRVAVPRDKTSRRALFAGKRCDAGDRRLACDGDTEICDLRNKLCRTMAELRKRQRPFGIREVRHDDRVFWGDEEMIAPLTRRWRAEEERPSRATPRPPLLTQVGRLSPAARVDETVRRGELARLFLFASSE